jgi:pimeloyl-ACP methyl ester carboxylesterase
MASIALLLETVAAAALALPAAGWTFERWALARQRRRYPAPGRQVDVGGRRLHLWIRGDAPGPTVVIEQGAGAAGAFWLPVLDDIAAFARVCLYDRAGYGWSDPAKGPRSMEDRVADLRRLLTAAEVPGPYVLVGHSYGGPLITLFARDYPQDTAGLVFADTPDLDDVLGPVYRKITARVHLPMMRLLALAARFGVLRLLRGVTRGLLPPHLSQEARDAMAATRGAAGFAAGADDIRSLHTASERTRRGLAPGALGETPVAVISHTERFPPPFDALENGFDEGQDRLAALSANSARVIAEGAGHLVQLDAPALVVDTIRRVHAAARDGTRLDGAPFRGVKAA